MIMEVDAPEADEPVQAFGERIITVIDPWFLRCNEYNYKLQHIMGIWRISMHSPMLAIASSHNDSVSGWRWCCVLLLVVTKDVSTDYSWQLQSCNNHLQRLKDGGFGQVTMELENV